VESLTISDHAMKATEVFAERERQVRFTLLALSRFSSEAG
jgi:hypothetical protein